MKSEPLKCGNLPPPEGPQLTATRASKGGSRLPHGKAPEVHDIDVTWQFYIVYTGILLARIIIKVFFNLDTFRIIASN